MMDRSVLMGLITMSLAGMDAPSAPPLIKEIIDIYFIPCLTLQEMGRLKCTSKGNSAVIDVENLLQNNSSYAFHHFFNNFSYDKRTMTLGHYGLTKNKEMFSFLQNKEKELRDDDVMYFNPLAPDLLEYCMELHATEYSTPEKIQQVRVKQLQMAVLVGNNDDNRFGSFLKKILPRSGFNIWDIKIVTSKKLLSSLAAKQKTKKIRAKIIKDICTSQDADLLLAIMGGIIEPRALKYIFWFSEKLFIEALREKNAFIENVPDKYNKTFQDYQKKSAIDKINSRYKHHGRLRG